MDQNVVLRELKKQFKNKTTEVERETDTTKIRSHATFLHGIYKR